MKIAKPLQLALIAKSLEVWLEWRGGRARESGNNSILLLLMSENLGLGVEVSEQSCQIFQRY
jgi:hypothetical protein